MRQVEIKLTGCVLDSTCDFSNRDGEVFIVTCENAGINGSKLSPAELIKLARFLFKQPMANGDQNPALRAAVPAIDKPNSH